MCAGTGRCGQALDRDAQGSWREKCREAPGVPGMSGGAREPGQGVLGAESQPGEVKPALSGILPLFADK